MKGWTLEYIDEAAEDLKKLDGSVRNIVKRAIDKVLKNPLPAEEGGYGKALHNEQGRPLAGFCKIKLKKSGIRVVYKAVKMGRKMTIIIIGLRAGKEVYGDAAMRIRRHGL